MFGDYCVSCNFWLWQCQSCEPIGGQNSKICLFDWMVQFSLFDRLLQELEKKNTVGHTALFMLLNMTGPKFGQIYSKMMIVYCAHVNLHTELVKMDSSWMSVLTRRLHKGTRLSTIDGMIIFFRELAKCTFCSETVAKILIMWPFKSLPTTPP